MNGYHQLLRQVLEKGSKRIDRTGVGTISLFGHQTRYDLSKEFPLVTTKKIHWKSVVHELLWFIRGDQNIRYLNDNGVSIWNEWAKPDGNLGPIYGVQWRSWPDSNGKAIDQLQQVIEQIRTNPQSRRHIVSAWNVAEIPNMQLPPCHALFQFYVDGDRLSCQLYQRSADIFLGVPFNIASYSLLTLMIAQVCGLQPGEFIHTLGDAHLYLNHVEQAMTQLQREVRPLPTVRINSDIHAINDFSFSDIELIDYNPHPAIRAPIAV